MESIDWDRPECSKYIVPILKLKLQVNDRVKLLDNTAENITLQMEIKCIRDH